MVGLSAAALLAQEQLPGGAAQLVPEQGAQAGPPLPQGGDGGTDALNTVGLALLAYGLVQLLSKVIDRIPFGRGGADAAHPGVPAGFTPDDRKRLERLLELASAERDRLERISDQIATNQRLVGEALDGLRESNGKLDNILRKLRALWARVGRRRKDRG